MEIALSDWEHGAGGGNTKDCELQGKALHAVIGCCDMVEARSKSSRRHAAKVNKTTGGTEKDP